VILENLLFYCFRTFQSSIKHYIFFSPAIQSEILIEEPIIDVLIFPPLFWLHVVLFDGTPWNNILLFCWSWKLVINCRRLDRSMNIYGFPYVNCMAIFHAPLLPRMVLKDGEKYWAFYGKVRIRMSERCQLDSPDCINQTKIRQQITIV
jgi:hypothetical protein